MDTEQRIHILYFGPDEELAKAKQAEVNALLDEGWTLVRESPLEALSHAGEDFSPAAFAALLVLERDGADDDDSNGRTQREGLRR